MAPKCVLIVCTSHDKLGNTDAQTGAWAEEVVTPYYLFKDAGLEVDIASIKEGYIPIDQESLGAGFVTEHVTKYLEDDDLKKKLATSISVSKVSDLYDAVFLPGGHGAAYDFPENPELIALLEKHWAHDKIISSVCHGPAGIVNIRAPDGQPIVKGRKVTGFTNSEEAAVGKTDVVPFLLEDKLKDLGGLYECGPNWVPYALADGNLITGQNPQSSVAVAKLVLDALA